MQLITDDFCKKYKGRVPWKEYLYIFYKNGRLSSSSVIIFMLV